MINMKNVSELKRNRDVDELLRQSEEELLNPNTKFFTQEEVIEKARRAINGQ